MKTTKYVGLSLVAMTLLGGASVANAEKIKNQNGTLPTPTTIEVGDTTPGIDPLEPGKNDQKNLVLTNAPKAYKFSTTVQQVNYNLSSSLTAENITVFNDRADREWSVVAEVGENGQLQVDNAAQTKFDVNSFKIDGVELSNTGGDGIISKAEAVKTDANNSGHIIKPINKIEIGFRDDAKVLKNGNKLTGEIKYQLYNTPDGK